MSVADEHDQALSVVRDLLAKYPNVNAKVIIGKSKYFGVHEMNRLDLEFQARKLWA
jgi:hypothetical protein